MLADPFTITINGSAKTFNRTGNDSSSSTYKTADGLLEMRVSHQTTNKGQVRTLFRLDEFKVAADPVGAGENRTVSSSAQVVLERAPFGFTNTEEDNRFQGMKAALTTAVVTELLGGEV